MPPGTAVAGVGGGPSGLESQGDIALTDPVAPAVIEVHLKPGVMDPVAASTEQAIRDMGLPAVAVRTARRYELAGKVTPEQRAAIARKLLANAVIEDVLLRRLHAAGSPRPRRTSSSVTEVPIRDLDDAGLEKLSKRRRPVPEPHRDEGDPGPLPHARPRAARRGAGDDRPDLERALRPQDLPQRRAASTDDAGKRRRGDPQPHQEHDLRAPRRSWPSPGASASSRTTPA